MPAPCSPRSWTPGERFPTKTARSSGRTRNLCCLVAAQAGPCPLDHVNRQFHAPAPNRLWVSDFTHGATWSGFVYVAFAIDIYARRIIGWRASRTAHAGFIKAAWSTTATVAASIYQSSTQSVLQRLGSNPRSAASAIAMTMLWPRRSMVFTRPKSSIAEAHGDPLKPSNTPRSSGLTGSKTGSP